MKEPPPKTTGDKLDDILFYLKRMEYRDRVRMWGGIFHSFLGLIPLAITIWLLWYFYAHGGDFINQIIEQAARQAAAITGQSQGAIMKQLQENGVIQQLQQFLK